MYSDVGEGEVAVNCEKNTNFPEHPVFQKPKLGQQQVLRVLIIAISDGQVMDRIHERTK